MCPDRQTLSAFLDNQLEDVEASQISLHLEGCPECEKNYANLGRLSSVLATLKPDDNRLARSKADLSKKLAASFSGPGVSVPFWSRRISLPLPVALAAATALLAFGVHFIFNRSSVRPPVFVEQNQVRQNYQVIQRKDLADVLSVWEQNAEITIELPASQAIDSVGEPLIFREIDYHRN